MTSSMILSKVKQRPFLVGGVAAASLLYMNRRRRDRLPEGEIWLDMDLSRPLSKTPPGVDLSFVSGEPQPLYFRDVVDALEMAAKDNKVRGVLGRFSYRSWGGGYLACVQEVRDAVTRFREAGSDASATAGEGAEADGRQRKRFTIAVADTFGEGGPAVGEYFLASAFEKVLVQKTGYVGLTGSGGQKLFFRGFLDKYGIKPEVFAREEYKSAAESLVRKAYSPHEREAMTSLLTSMLDDVADGVAASRGFKDRKDVYAIMHDCPLPATLALSANLIDGIMYEDDVESMVKAGFKKKTADAENDATAGEKIELLKTSVAESEDNILSTFADSEESKYTRVSMRDYIKKMRKDRASEGVLDTNMLPDSVKGAKNPAPKNVALVNANGAITRFADPGVGPGSTEQATSSALCKRLQEVIDDPSIGAVVLRVDSPGGSAVASDSIAAAVRRVRLAGKPVVCSMGDLAASGGYMIAAACDTIVAQPTTITGSIGVIAAKLSVQRLLKAWGIQVDSIELSENHLAFSPLQEFSPQQRNLMEKRVGEIYEDFVGGVAAGRNMSVDEVLKVAKGRVWTGRQALDRGLVDELGGLNIAVAIAKDWVLGGLRAREGCVDILFLDPGTLAKHQRLDVAVCCDGCSKDSNLSYLHPEWKAGGLAEDARVVEAKRRSLVQAATVFISGGGDSMTETTGGVRSAIFALAYAIVGVDAMEALFSTLSLLASANDLAKGKMPNERVRAGQGDLEIDVEAVFE